MKGLLVFLFVMFSVVLAHGQDLIITKANFKIQCKIVGEDSLSLFYRIENHPDALEIKRADVKESYYNILRQKKRKTKADVSSGTTSTTNPKDGFHFSMTSGAGLPLGEFASTVPNNPEAGLAKTGFLFRLQGVVKLAPGLGICGAYHLQRNPINTTVFNDAAQQANPGIPFRTTATSWGASGFFGGLHLEHTFPNADFTLYAQTSVGWVRYRSPEVVSSVALPGVYFNATIGSDDDNALGYQFSGGMRLKIMEAASLHVGLGYFAGRADFDYVVYSNTQGFSMVSGFSQPFSVLNMEIGLVLTARRKK